MDLGGATTEPWDWTAEMQRVARSFRGNEGVFVQFGDSLTLARPNVLWALLGPGHTPEERAFLRWAHAGEDNESDGWYLATTPKDPNDPRHTAFTAAIGCSARYLISGEKGLPRLEDMIAMYRPQLALYALGASDIIRGTSLPDYVRDVEQAIDLLVDHGTVPIIATVTPSEAADDAVRRMNDALRDLARRRRLPVVDVYAAMAHLNEHVLAFLEEDGVHLTWEHPTEAPTVADFRRSGYLLRCFLIIRKGMEVKAKVLEPTAPRLRESTAGYEGVMAKREKIQPNEGDSRYVRRDEDGQFTEDQVDVGRSSAADQRQQAEHTSKPGHGDEGDRS